jgi:hypothetical protein
MSMAPMGSGKPDRIAFLNPSCGPGGGLMSLRRSPFGVPDRVFADEAEV